MTSKKLIELTLSGKSAEHVIEALLEELPPLPALKSSIMQDLPKYTKVKIEENVVYLGGENRRLLHERAEFLSLVYPELEFVVR